MSSYPLNNKVRWNADDDAAFWDSYPDYRAALAGDDFGAGHKFRTGYDPGKVPDGAPVPPSIGEIARAKDRSQRVETRIHAQDFPHALPLAPLLRRLKRPMPADVALLAEQYTPYLLVYGIDVEPAKGERMHHIRIRIRYADQRRFITHSLAPDTELEERYAIGVTVQQGINLDLTIGAPPLALVPGVQVAPGLTTDVHASMLVHWQHRRVAAQIVATGVRRSLAQWTFNDPKLLVGRVDLRAVVLAPKRARRLPIAVDGEFRVQARGIRPWRGTTVELSSEPVPARLVAVRT